LVVLVATLVTLLVGAAHKSLCLGSGFAERSVELACYSDFIPLYEAEELSEGRVPYLQAANEYPVGTGLFMWLASLPATGHTSFFVWNSVMLGVLALVTAGLLHRLVGARALFFALAPSLALYAFLNWDLLPVAAMTGAIAAYLRGRDGVAGGLLGLGAATKVIPGLLVPPLAWDRVREGATWRAIWIVGSASLVWLSVNLPIALESLGAWGWSYRLNAERPVHWATLWFIGCRVVDVVCRSVPLANAVSFAAFLVGVAVVWHLKGRAEPGFPVWTFGFPVLVVFLLTNKVYSPQYSLWLVPWFALVLPRVRSFLAFEAADLFVFLTEFSWLSWATGGSGAPRSLLQLAVLTRAGVLVWLLVAFVRSDVRALAPSTARRVGPVSRPRARSPNAART
jgi:uncharacterized membrane protein